MPDEPVEPVVLDDSGEEGNGSDPVTIEISGEAYDALEEIARRRGVGVVEALLDAIGSDLFMLRQRANGSKILIKRPDASVEELLVDA